MSPRDKTFAKQNNQCLSCNRANELKVSRRTVLRDITALTQEYDVETVRGRYGGVYLRKDKNAKRLAESQKRTLKELLTVANLKRQQDILEIISKFSN